MGSRATSYHLLSARVSKSEASSAIPKPLELGPITVPRYLDRSGIVVETATDQLVVSDLHQWAEPMADNLTRVLRTNLEACAALSRVEIYPRKNRSTEFSRLSMDILEFQKTSSGPVSLKARVAHGAERKEVEFLTVSMPCEVADSDVRGIVSCMNQALGELSGQLCSSFTRG